MTNLTSERKGVGYTMEAATSVEKSERVAEGDEERERRGGKGGDGYTELPNEATAVDFVQPLCRMRQWSCNRLPINNALVSGARARRKEEKKKKKKSPSAREVEGWRDGGYRKGERNVSDVTRTSSSGVVRRHPESVRARRRRGGISSLPVRYTNRVYASPDRCAVSGGWLSVAE